MSDLLIKGMEMPSNCMECPMWAMGTACQHCKANDRWESYRKTDKRQDVADRLREGCPLVEIPTHGRLIDADLFLATHWMSDVVSDAIKDTPTVMEASE